MLNIAVGPDSQLKTKGEKMLDANHPDELMKILDLAEKAEESRNLAESKRNIIPFSYAGQNKSWYLFPESRVACGTSIGQDALFIFHPFNSLLVTAIRTVLCFFVSA